MSRFAANPKWLIYLPPTMSPCETSQAEGFLEHPAEAFAYYRSNGVPEGGLRREAHGLPGGGGRLPGRGGGPRKRFGVAGGEAGIVYTRTGRRFFDDAALETEFLDRVRAAMDAAGLLGASSTPTGSAWTAS